MRRVGLLIPHTDTTLEFDLQRELDRDISVHTERMFLADVTLASERKMVIEELPRALRYLDALPLDVAVFGCTSAGTLDSFRGDARLREKMNETLRCPVVSAFHAVYERLQHIRAQNIALITPYTEHITTQMAEQFHEAGISVQFQVGMGITNDIATGNVTPDEIVRYVEQYKQEVSRSETIFLSCTNLRALECKTELEQLFSLPVVTSNEAIIVQLKRLLHKKMNRHER